MKRTDQLNINDLEYHLRSAVDSLVPDVLERIDLDTPQEELRSGGRILSIRPWLRRAERIAAACLCAAVLAGGFGAYQARRVDSIIGIDVNPSIELSVNKKNRVLEAEALNQDALEILDDMELKNVDLNVAVNAVIGSMVQKGYLDDMDNAILVTVANDDEAKAADIREMVVGDIESSLQENQVQAIVYNQQAVTDDEVSKLAEEYGISYGKAYFLQELIAQNETLTGEDMEQFASMTMEEIAKEIADASYDLGDSVNQSVEVTLAQRETEEATSAAETTESESATETETQTEPKTMEGTSAIVTAVPSETETEEETQSSEELNIKIDYVDFDGQILDVVFKSKVKWRNYTVAVYDGSGDSYSAHIIDTGSTSCSISVSGLPGDEECSFVIGGVALKNGNHFGTVKGYFVTPDISEHAEGAPPTEESTAETESESAGETSSQAPTELPSEAQSSEPEELLPETTETGGAAETEASPEAPPSGEGGETAP